MYRICVKGHFDAAHALRGYGGKCERLHGHRWQVVACVEAEGLNEIGLAYDFTELKAGLARILARFDHTNLNETPPFDQINPSSENIARTIYEELAAAIQGVRLQYVEAWESPDAGARYSEG